MIRSRRIDKREMKRLVEDYGSHKYPRARTRKARKAEPGTRGCQKGRFFLTIFLLKGMILAEI